MSDPLQPTKRCITAPQIPGYPPSGRVAWLTSMRALRNQIHGVTGKVCPHACLCAWR